jgi:class 3 adenylate cyclase/pimeloyl-ACP methyl ester carboxylesterase
MGDLRGTGLSQHDVSDESLEALAADLAAIVKSEGLADYDLWGGMGMCGVTITHAVAYPQQVKSLVLLSPYARGLDFRSPDSVRTMTDLIAGGGWSIARRNILAVNLPSGPPDATEWAERWLRKASPERFLAGLQRELAIDVRELLPRIKARTLILHRRGLKFVPASAAKSVAAGIRGSTLAMLEGDAAFPWVNPQQLLRPVMEFLDGRTPGTGGGESARGTAPQIQAGALRSVLFTDLVGHTEMMSRLGDERGRAVLREHEDITRNVLKQHGGTEVKTMGDGFMASFGSVTKAVECAVALQRAFAEREGEPLAVRVGLNAGEPIEEDGDLFGATVILASRIAAKAGAGEILVADTVRGLCSGKGFLFADRGEFVAKGFEEPVRVYEVSWRGSD